MYQVNPGAVGFYRVKYPREELARLVDAVRQQALLPLDRLGLLVDLFALVQAGHAPTVEVRFIQYCQVFMKIQIFSCTILCFSH